MVSSARKQHRIVVLLAMDHTAGAAASGSAIFEPKTAIRGLSELARWLRTRLSREGGECYAVGRRSENPKRGFTCSGTCLATGVAGFMGSHRAGRLLEEGGGVIDIDSFANHYPRAMSLSQRLLFLVAVVLGVLFVTLGLSAEMLMRIYHESQGKPIYSV